MRADHSWPQRRQLYQAIIQELSGAGSTDRPQAGQDIAAVVENVWNMPAPKGNARADCRTTSNAPDSADPSGRTRNYVRQREKQRTVQARTPPILRTDAGTQMAAPPRIGTVGVKRHGLRNGRRLLGVAGLSAAALSLTAAIFAPSGNLALVCLSCAYGGILFQQPILCALCLDVGRRNAGAVFGFMNTAANAASALSAVVFGYLVGYFGNYNTPFIPMVALLSLGALLWLQVDPTRELFPEKLLPDGQSGFESHQRHAIIPA
jgi:hypothetical protein